MGAFLESSLAFEISKWLQSEKKKKRLSTITKCNAVPSHEAQVRGLHSSTSLSKYMVNEPTPKDKPLTWALHMAP